MPHKFDRSLRDAPRRDCAGTNAYVEAEAIAFAEALRRIRDAGHRACVRWFVIGLANDN